MTRIAFTLLELLIVIALIAMLLTLLLPSLKMARESAKKIRCASSHRQILLAAASYAGECDGWLPWQMYSAGCSAAYWLDKYEYLKADSGAWECPNSFVVNAAYKDPDPSGQIIPGTSYVTLAANQTTTAPYSYLKDAKGRYHPLQLGYEAQFGQTAGQGPPTNTWRIIIDPRKMSSFQFSAKVAVAADSAHPHYTYGWDRLYSGRLQPRHNNSYNVVFLDGHAASFSSNEAYDSYRDDSWIEPASARARYYPSTTSGF